MRRCRLRRRISWRAPHPEAQSPKSLWSTDFVPDQTSGFHFRGLTIIDDVSRECLAAVLRPSITGKRVAREMTALTPAAYDRVTQQHSSADLVKRIVWL